MRAFIIFLLSMIAQETFATSFGEISPGRPLCLSANFSPDHMKAHPRQKTSAIWMKLYMEKDPKDPTVYMNIQLTINREIYRAGLICDRKPNGSLHCAIECDGGQAELWPGDSSKTDVFLVNKGLHINGACDPIDQPIFWEPTPGGDDLFNLQTEACDP